jgi:predicted TIM-barrel fold metal-dependent hydrolase
VFGLQAKACGVWVPNEVVAEYVAAHPDKLVGWASVDPNDPGCVEQLVYCVEHLGLRGLKLGPAYQHFDPRDRAHWPLFSACARLGVPIIWHQGATFPKAARLSLAAPLQLEDVAMDFPEVKMIIAHLGHPWEEDTIVLMRKCANVFADISALHYRPWRYWQAMTTAIEYGVEHKLLLGSDFPSATLRDVIDGLARVNVPVENSGLPQVPKDVQEQIVHENWRRFFTWPL